jgi:hypothetical protein
MSSNFETLIFNGNRADQPAAGIPGRLYKVDDENIVERDNGSTWELFAVCVGGGAGTDTTAIHTDGIFEFDGISEEISPASGDRFLIEKGDYGEKRWVDKDNLGGGGGGSLILLQSHDASSSATLDFTSQISSTYDEYVIELVDLVPQNNNVDFYMRLSINNGSSYDTGSNYINNSYIVATSGNTQINETLGAFVARNAGEISNGANKSVCGTLKLYSPGSANYKKLLGDIFWHGGSNYIHTMVNGIYIVTTAVDAFQFLFSSGNIVSGSIRLYGIKKS